MKRVLLITCCFVFFTFLNAIAGNSTSYSADENHTTENQPQKSGSSIAGGLLILVSIGVGYGTRKIYEMRSKNQEEIH